MPRFFTPRGMRALQAEVSDAALWALVTVTYPPDGTTFRVVNNLLAVVSRGLTFTPFAFDFSLAEDSLDRAAQVEFSIDNVGMELIDMLRAASVPPELLIEIIVSDTPDVIELTLPNLLLRNVQWNKTTVTGTLQVDDVFGLAFPSRYSTYDPRQYPGLFA